jgi:hypothetical protein
MCGNGMLDPGEGCDGSDFGGKTCQSLGLGSGTLTCNACCSIVATGCQPKENCTNDMDDNGNGLVDCQDPDCVGAAACLDSCPPSVTLQVPGFYTGDNSGRPNVHHATCSSQMSGSEEFFQFTAPTDGNVTITLFSFSGFNYSISARSVCADDTTEIACSKPDPMSSGQTTLTLPVVTGQSYLIMVEGMTVADVGQYDLQTDIPLPEDICDNMFDDDMDGYLDCDDATSCQTLPECMPGVNPTGTTCFANNQCTANQNDPICLQTAQFPNGYCSEFCDVAAQDCAANAICYAGLNLSVHGVCLQTCTQDTDCRAADGYACVDMGLSQKVCMLGPETQCDDYIDNDGDGLYDCNDPSSCQSQPACTPGANAVGQPCTLHNECFSTKNNPLCLDENHVGYPGGYCSRYCDPAVPADCGASAICVPQGPNGENVCMQACTSNAQCRTGYFCQNFGYPKMICSF